MHWLIDFVFPRRLHRVAYFVRAMVVEVVAYSLYRGSTTVNPVYFWAPFLVLMIYELFFICLPRTRDINMSGWWLLIVLVPIANVWLGLILLFRPPAMFCLQKPNATPEPVPTVP